MRKIKSKLVKKTAKILAERGVEFNDNFEKNKIILERTMPSKQPRNQIAGHVTRVNKQKK